MIENKANDIVPPAPRQAPGRPALTTFLDHLVKNGVVSHSVAVQASEWKRTHEKDKRTLAEILEKEFGVPRDVLRYQVALYYAFRVIELNDPAPRRLPLSDINKMMRALPEPVFQQAMKLKVLPYDLAEQQNDKLVIVTPNPSEREIHDVTRAFSYQKFELCYMKENDWAQFWRQVTAERERAATPVVEEIDESGKEESESGFEVMIDKEIARAQLPSAIESVLADAVRKGATDIHFVPRGNKKTEVLIRVQGQLFVWHAFEDVRSEAVIAALKVRVFNLDRYERFAVQEGIAQRSIDRSMVWFRASVLPVASREPSSKCESIVLHVLRAVDQLPTLAQLDLDPSTRSVLADALAPMRGLVVFAGGTRSGKTNTLMAALRSVMHPSRSTVAVEESPEFLIDGARQVKINSRLATAGALHAVLQHDPDIVMVDSLRTAEVAHVALEVANIGHLVLSGMSSRDAVSALLSLMHMASDPYAVVQGLNAVIAQHALRHLCDRCKQPIDEIPVGTPEWLGTEIEKVKGLRLYKAAGCSECKGGYRGTFTLYEALPITPGLHDLLMQKDTVSAPALIEAALAAGLRPFRQRALEPLMQGSTTVEEISALPS